ncbi:S1 RNA-binding domain-containing protein [Streptomyces sp. NPDC020480]|uniref:S1 RNA-binding domain-containing protein n=1 Tax=Streptomyces sp. NPDC020480 TaxID=3365076 RepID=UPI003798A2ED
MASGAIRDFLGGLRPGGIVTGAVESIHTFGVFVRIDGEPDGRCTGFIRIPELAWTRYEHPSDIVRVGERLSLEVLHADLDRGQASLSLRALREDPMVAFADTVGQVVTGPVTKLVPFGLFVRVADGIEGLVPLPEPQQVVGEGDELTVQIVEVDLERRRVLLSAVSAVSAGSAGSAR